MTVNILEQLKKEPSIPVEVNPEDLKNYCFLEEFSFQNVLACSRKQSILWEFMEESIGQYSYEAQYQGKYLTKELSVCYFRLTINIDSYSVVGILTDNTGAEIIELSYASLRKLFLAYTYGLDCHNVHRIDTIALLYASKGINIRESGGIKNYLKNIFEDRANWQECEPSLIKKLFYEDCLVAFSYPADIDFDIFCIVKTTEKNFPIFTPVSYVILMNRDIYITCRISDTLVPKEIRSMSLPSKARDFFISEHGAVEISPLLEWIDDDPNNKLDIVQEDIPDEEFEDFQDEIIDEEFDEISDQPVKLTDDGKIQLSEFFLNELTQKTTRFLVNGKPAYFANNRKKQDPWLAMVAFKHANGLRGFSSFPLTIDIHLSGLLAKVASELIPEQPLQRNKMDIYNHNGCYIGRIEAPFNLEKLEKTGKLRVDNVFVSSVSVSKNLSSATVRIILDLTDMTC